MILNPTKNRLSQAIQAGAQKSRRRTLLVPLLPILTLGSGTVLAQDEGASDQDTIAMLEEVLVTARRIGESLQDVPQTVNVVKGDALEEYSIHNFEDMDVLVPGLSLESSDNGFTSSASMRGVAFNAESGASPTVEFYLNEAPVASSVVFQSMFDVGQIEVLKGPQGTLRGKSSPSGAITITTNKPVLNEFEGYVSTTASNIDSSNVQGAVNIPILEDKIALRVAGTTDDNEANGVRSVHSSKEPSKKTDAVRASVIFTPVEALEMTLTYQDLTSNRNTFVQVAGEGSPGGQVPGRSYDAPPAGYNGPSIQPEDRLGITDDISQVEQKHDVLIAEAQWYFSGQKLSYVGSITDQSVTSKTPVDFANMLPDFEYYRDLNTGGETKTHELRIGSEDPLGGWFSYVAGVFSSKAERNNSLTAPSSFQDGAFGTPLGEPDPSQPNLKFTIPITVAGNSDTEETSIFANIIMDISDSTELAIGGRYISFEDEGGTGLFIESGYTTLTSSDGFPAPLNALPISMSCGLAGGEWEATYDAVCDLPTPAFTLQELDRDVDDDTFVYNISLSNTINDDLMLYGNVGTSWRAGPTSVGVTSEYDETLESLVFLDAEESTSYEVGFKSSFLDGKATLNAALYHQVFDNYFYFTDEVPYLSVTPRSTGVSTFQFTSNVDAQVTGVDIEASAQITDNWSATLAANVTDSSIDDDAIPCVDSNFDGVPDTGTPTVEGFQEYGRYVALCQSDDSISKSPDWQVTLTSEYFHPIGRNMEAYVRGIYTHYPDNDNANKGFTASSYGLLNLYTGVISTDGSWEVGAFVKNALEEQELTNRESSEVASFGGLSSIFGGSGYRWVGYTPRREAGISLRYRF